MHSLAYYNLEQHLSCSREVDDIGPGLSTCLLWRDFEPNLEVFRQVYLGVRQTPRQQHRLLGADEKRRTVHIRRQCVVTAIEAILGWLARVIVFGCVGVVVACAH